MYQSNINDTKKITTFDCRSVVSIIEKNCNFYEILFVKSSSQKETVGIMNLGSHFILNVFLERIKIVGEARANRMIMHENILVNTSTFKKLMFLVGAFSLKEKSPTITVGSFFSRRLFP